MCEPTSLFIASLAISGASAGAQLAAENQAGKAQSAYQRQLTEAGNREAAGALTNLRIRESQSQESLAREKEKARLATQRARSTATVAAGEAGVSGNSVDALLQEYQMQQGQYTEAVNRQSEFEAAATSDEAAAIQRGTEQQNLSINAPIARPNFLASALKLGGQTLGAYRDYNPDAFTRRKK